MPDRNLLGNDIPTVQNDTDGQHLLGARQAVYSRASSVQHIQLVLTLLAPAAGTIVALGNQETRPYVAALALIIAIVDAAFLDRVQRQTLRLAAKICEEFDTLVLKLPWNAFVCGHHVDPETIAAAASKWKGEEKLKSIQDWYPPSVARAPLHLARIICQRTNLWYDSTLRRRYAFATGALTWAVVVGLFLAGLFAGMTMLDFVITLMTPAAPVLIWLIREHFRQSDTADAQETVKAEAEALWQLAKRGACLEPECLEKSRAFQNSIYLRRASSPLIFPFVYRLLRSDMEEQMRVGADKMLRELP